MNRRALLVCVVWMFAGAAALAADPPKRLLLVTHSGGYIHNSVAEAEKVLKRIGPGVGLDVSCYRFTNDPDAIVKVKRKVNGQDVEVETTALEAYNERFRAATGEPVSRDQCGRINAATLAKVDAVLFFTTGDPVNKEEMADLLAWVRRGGAFAGTHCATDTLYGTPSYGTLIGGYFDGHPWTQKVRLRLEDPNHPAAKGLPDGAEIDDEIYQFRDNPYSRARLHIIHRIDNDSINVAKGKRQDKDYAVSWCQLVGQGRSFYTSLGHRKEVWNDRRFQAHLIGGLKWALGQLPGDATPSGEKKSGT